jgi:hypothetical protein
MRSRADEKINGIFGIGIYPSNYLFRRKDAPTGAILS